jgi:hypothetical protein
MANDFAAQMLRAQERVAQMDAIDGFKDRALATIHAALKCGLQRPETGAAYDALVMLESLLLSQEV